MSNLNMSFSDWDEALADDGIELEDAADAMDIEMDEIEQWQKVDEVPAKAIAFLYAGDLDTAEAVIFADLSDVVKEFMSSNDVTKESLNDAALVSLKNFIVERTIEENPSLNSFAIKLVIDEIDKDEIIGMVD
jgi:hypothetical protein